MLLLYTARRVAIPHQQTIQRLRFLTKDNDYVRTADKKKLDGANFTHPPTHPSIQTLFGNQTIGCEKCYLPWHQRASVIYSYLKLAVLCTSMELFGDTCPINLCFRVRPGPIHQLPYLSRIFFNLFTLQSPLQTSPAEAARSRHHDYR